MSDVYSSAFADESRVTEVDAGHGRTFLVVSFKLRDRWKTLVFQQFLHRHSTCWIPRHELEGLSLDPLATVTGILLSHSPIPHPLEELKRDLDLCRKANWTLRTKLEISEKRALTMTGKRGKRGSRDS